MRLGFIICSVLGFLVIQLSNGYNWPIPYERVKSRPVNNPYCQAGLVPFCPSGKTVNAMPFMESTDVIEVFSLKKPVWSFKYGPLLGYFHIMHDALGFRNKRTGLNYTMEWYELDQLFNCTFPHVIQNKSLTWCNQGALCSYDGIVDNVWTEYGSLIKISEITGEVYNKFANWSLYDNNTAVYYETWTVYNQPEIEEESAIMYFDSFDCASWVLRSLDKLYQFGADFNLSVKLNYTRLNLIAEEPLLIGNYSIIFNGSNETLKNDILNFYSGFQKTTDYLELIADVFTEIFIRKEFYFYYNSQYWYLKLKEPYIKISYDEQPLPGSWEKNIFPI